MVSSEPLIINLNSFILFRRQIKEIVQLFEEKKMNQIKYFIIHIFLS